MTPVHKVDGPHQGSRQKSKKWTDPTRVTNLYKSTKWTDPTKGHDPGPQNGRTQPGSNLYKSKKWTDPTRVTNLYKSTKWMDTTKGHDPRPHNGRTKPCQQLIHVHDMDGPNNGQNSSPRRGWTQ